MRRRVGFTLSVLTLALLIALDRDTIEKSLLHYYHAQNEGRPPLAAPQQPEYSFFYPWAVEYSNTIFWIAQSRS